MPTAKKDRKGPSAKAGKFNLGTKKKEMMVICGLLCKTRTV
jgi:hypothetical protein